MTLKLGAICFVSLVPTCIGACGIGRERRGKEGVEHAAQGGDARVVAAIDERRVALGAPHEVVREVVGEVPQLHARAAGKYKTYFAMGERVVQSEVASGMNACEPGHGVSRACGPAPYPPGFGLCCRLPRTPLRDAAHSPFALARLVVGELHREVRLAPRAARCTAARSTAARPASSAGMTGRLGRESSWGRHASHV